MRVLITFIGGASSIEGDSPCETMEELLEVLGRPGNFITVEKTPYGDVVVNQSAISYIRRKQ